MNFEDQRYMIDKASELAASGEEVFLEIGGFGSLNVRDCSIASNRSNYAQIECWSNGDAPGKTVVVRLEKVLGLRVQERQGPQG